MPTSLFARLDSSECARALSLPLFADSERLAHKPRCSMTKGYSMIRTAPNALRYPYIQPNSPVACARIVFDLDWHQEKHRFHKLPLRYLADRNAWENDLGVPEPNWVALSKDKNSAHIAYELEVPVGLHVKAHPKPQSYLAAIKRGLALKLGADVGFTGQLCKNPLHSDWDLYKGLEHARELQELAEYVEETPIKFQAHNREKREEVGRNVSLFDETRFWAYDNIDGCRGAGYDAWEQTVIGVAEQINAASYDRRPLLAGRGPLPFTECRSIGKSVARWSWAHYGKHSPSATFRQTQAFLGARGAKATAKIKRERREKQVLEAIGQLTAKGLRPTMCKVAEAIGCSKGTLSMHYRHLFLATLP